MKGIVGRERPPNRTYPALGLSLLDRAMKEYFAGKPCSKADIDIIRRYFHDHGGVRCVYCGDTKPKQWRWDHVHPVSKGGRTVIGNLVPACSSCDDSKQEKTLDEWFASRSKGRPEPGRHKVIRRITARYSSHFRYRPVDFPAGLDKKQKQTYDEFQRRVGALRRFLDREKITKGRGKPA